MTISITMLCHYVKRQYAECYVSFMIMVNVIMLNVVMLNVVMLNVIILNVILLNVVMLSVLAPLYYATILPSSITLCGLPRKYQ